MNLMERKHNTEDENERRDQEMHSGLHELLHKPYMSPILLGVIAVLLICIIVLLVFIPDRRNGAQVGLGSDIQQSITDYANEQKQNDYVSGLSGETVSIDLDEEQDNGKADQEDMMKEVNEEFEAIAEDSGKIAIVVDVEDENDIFYTKEFILSEAFPYFEDNNQEAIWDLAHLKRYVKLSAELKDTNQYYYQGDVNGDGKPNGKGLAIYEDNSYYYGDWSNGERSGNGRWFRFYINEKSKRNAMGIYTAHSYAGEWKDDLPNGQGAEHYEVDVTKIKAGERVMQNVVGEFSASLYNGDMFANTVDYRGVVDEWYGVASKGVFALWREMSSIGECSVWSNKNNEESYIEIDKKENKNQGIQELLRSSVK